MVGGWCLACRGGFEMYSEIDKVLWSELFTAGECHTDSAAWQHLPSGIHDQLRSMNVKNI